MRHVTLTPIYHDRRSIHLQWIVATMFAFCVSILMVFTGLPISSAYYPDSSILLLDGLILALVGLTAICQWFVLRPHLRGAGWWIVASVAGLALLTLLDWLSPGVAQFHDGLDRLAEIGIGLFVIGVGQAFALKTADFDSYVGILLSWMGTQVLALGLAALIIVVTLAIGLSLMVTFDQVVGLILLAGIAASAVYAWITGLYISGLIGD